MRRLPGYAVAALGAALLVCALSTMATAAGSIARPQPRILSASWGTDNAVGCPSGEQDLDNIPVTFSWFIRRASIQTTDFEVVRSDGSVATPTCALQFPPDESDEAQTVNLIGHFGESVNGPTPVAIRIVGALQGKAPGAIRWRRIPPLPEAEVEPLSGGPYIVDAWTLTPAIYRGDANRCTVGKTFVRVMWSNGLTAYPTGTEVGAPVVASYRAIYKLPNGKVVAIAPLEVADLHDHASSANADNMHDLCLPRLPRGAKLTGVTIGGGLIQDPNGDPNAAQKFRTIAASQASTRPEPVGLKVTSGPKGVVTRHFATFRFKANPGAYDFSCKLDERHQRPCSSPVTFRHLSSGTHSLQISARIRQENGGEGAVALLRWTIR